MANHKSSLKSIRQTEKRTARNTAHRSRVRGTIRKVQEAILAGNKSEAKKFFSEMESVLMKGAQHNLYHFKSASRKISRMSSKIKSL